MLLLKSRAIITLLVEEFGCERLSFLPDDEVVNSASKLIRT
jgi:hypothetical protein